MKNLESQQLNLNVALKELPKGESNEKEISNKTVQSN